VGDVGVALLATAVIVGFVLLGVAWVAWLGVRYSGRTLSPLATRRLAWFNVLFGVLALIFTASVLAFGRASLFLALIAVQGLLALASGWSQLRALARAGSET
jgi:hypothetical protein